MQNNPIDVVYVLGKGSLWQNNEIRFSLRSVVRNLKGYRNVWIVGELPGFIRNVIHIPFPDELGPQNADGNIIRKVLRACKEEDLSDTFLLFSDDDLIIKPTEASTIPFYHKGDRFKPGYFDPNIWRKRLGRTMDILKTNGFTTYHYDCHIPMLINKRLFPKIVDKFDYYRGIGYTVKSLYANPAKVAPTRVPNTNYTLFHPYTSEEIEERLKDWQFMSFQDTGLTETLKNWLFVNYHEPSRYEKD